MRMCFFFNWDCRAYLIIYIKQTIIGKVRENQLERIIQKVIDI